MCLTDAGEVPGRGESCSCDHPNGCYNPCDPSNGPGNTEDGNTEDGNSGNGNSGDGNSGNGNTEDGNSGNGNSGDGNSGDGNTEDGNSGNGNTEDGNSGNGNSGDGNSGNGNSGNGNSGDGNSGDGNSGDGNSGDGNSGDGNSGDGNTEDGNSGDGNSGNGNSGDGNTGRGDNNNGGRGNGSKATVPTAPRGLTVTAGNEEASLKWSPPSDDGGTPVVGYEYQQRVEGEGFGKTWLKVDGGGDIRGVTITGLENGITYFFRVRAVNKVDEGKPSNEARATPLAPLVTLAVVRSSVAEGEDAVFVLRRTNEIKTALDVKIRVDESGDILVDGYQAPTLVTFPAGELEYRLSIATADDAVDEAEGTVTVTLVKGAGYELGSPDTVTIAVRDNDDAPELAVADAQAIEDAGVMVFSVKLNAPSSLTITVDYATSDGTAAAGADYSAAYGSLLFMPGDVERTVSVLLQADEMYEADETFVLTLSNPVNAELADAAATGTVISDDDTTPVALAWLSRFGRTVATQVVDTLESRFYGAFTDEASVTLGGLQMSPGLAPVTLDEPALGWDADMASIHGLAWTGANRQVSGASSPDMRRLLSMSSFKWTSGAGAHSSGNSRLDSAPSADNAGFVGTAAPITYWGRGTLTEFDSRDGDIILDGDVLTGTLATDYEGERLLGGLAVSYSDGDGSFRMSGTEGDLDATLVSIYPYARLEMTDNISAWAVLGYGTGDMKMTTDTGEATVDTDIEMKLSAMGMRGVLLSTETLAVALKSDAFLVSMDADATEGLESPIDTDVGRVRMLLEGSHSRTLSGGGILRPALEFGLRYDDAEDAETGFGLELGGALRYSDPAHGLTMEAKARALLAHEDGGYEEWGVGGYLHLDPSVAGRGVSLRLDSSWGAMADGANRLWAHQNTGGLASDTYTNPMGRIDLELGYGMDVPGGYGVLIPYSALELTGGDSRTYRLGWQYILDGDSLYMSLDGMRRERDGDSPDHGLMLRTSLPW